MSVISASPFTILRDWTNNMLADSHRGFDSIATRLSRMAGDSTNYILIWGKTAHGGVDSGCFTTMEQAGTTHVGPGILQFVSFLRTLPAAVQEEIKNALSYL